MAILDPKIPRYLITTDDEGTWKFDRPVIFLGEWCRLYERRQIWEAMDAVVAEPYGLAQGQGANNIEYAGKLYRQLLEELAVALNTFHQVRHSLRYWEIVLGRWLLRYVTVVFNRYFTLEQALHRYEISAASCISSDAYSLATTDSMSFIWACGDSLWNQAIYSRILTSQEICTVKIEEAKSVAAQRFVMEEMVEVSGGGQMWPRRAIYRLMSNLYRNKDAFIINSYLPPLEEIKLQLNLGQCPQNWRSPPLQQVAPDREVRQAFGIDVSGCRGFERVVRSCLGEALPSCYLEGYGQLVTQAENLPWPATPRFIFTSNNFDMDEIFKVWAGSKVEEGAPYFIGQHGNNYGTLQGSPTWPELTTPDRFFTWGWADENPVNVPAFVFSIAGRKPEPADPHGGLLLIELHPPVRCDLEDSYFRHGVYQEEQFRFVAALPEHVRRKLTVRLHHIYKKLKWADKQRWADRCPDVCVETGTTRLSDLMAESRLVVHSYDSTGILEGLASNIPTLCFWQGGLEHLLPSAKPYYELLREVGILADSPEHAAGLITARWDNIEEWWTSQKVQDARKAFCGQYARRDGAPARTLRRLLSGYAAKHRP